MLMQSLLCFEIVLLLVVTVLWWAKWVIAVIIAYALVRRHLEHYGRLKGK